MKAKISPTGYWEGDKAHIHHAHSKELAEYITTILRGAENDPIYDLGCGQGYYLKHLEDNGFKYLLGFEGEVPAKKFFINIIQQDLAQDLDIPVKGHVICLEVLEHIPQEYEKKVVNNIKDAIGLDCLLILSWAVEGQEGYGHVNCRNNDYVIDLFERKGFKYLPYLSNKARESVGDDTPWFRNTLMIFKK